MPTRRPIRPRRRRSGASLTAGASPWPPSAAAGEDAGAPSVRRPAAVVAVLSLRISPARQPIHPRPLRERPQTDADQPARGVEGGVGQRARSERLPSPRRPARPSRSERSEASANPSSSDKACTHVARPCATCVAVRASAGGRADAASDGRRPPRRSGQAGRHRTATLATRRSGGSVPRLRRRRASGRGRRGSTRARSGPGPTAGGSWRGGS